MTEDVQHALTPAELAEQLNQAPKPSAKQQRQAAESIAEDIGVDVDFVIAAGEQRRFFMDEHEQAPPPVKVTAPFSAEQVASLNDYQWSGFMHPFTCPREHVYRWTVGEEPEPFDRDELYDLLEPIPGHMPGVSIRTGHTILVATEAGWRCPNDLCTYTQDWAHDFMADRLWQRAQEDIRRARGF